MPKKPEREGAGVQLGPWEFRFVYERQNGTAVLASIAVAPVGSEFRGCVLPDRAVPRGGITRETLQGFKIEEQIRNAVGVRAFSVSPRRSPPTTPMRPTKPKPGRPAHSDWSYAVIAVEYEQRGRAGSRTPTKDMARTYHKSPEQMTALVAKARRYGFLTKGTPGRSGGKATAKALKVLEEYGVDVARITKAKARITKAKKATTRKGKRR